MHVSAVLPANGEAFVGVQPGEGPLHRPAHRAQPRAVRRAAAADDRADPASTQPPTIGVVVIASVAEHRHGPATWSAAAAADRRDRV